MQSFYYLGPSYTQSLTVSTTYGGAFQAEENITAAYAMGGVTFGKLKITAGARFEDTDFTMNGWQYGLDHQGGDARDVPAHLQQCAAVRGLHLRYESPDDREGLLDNNMARPDYSDTAPGRAINDSARTVQQGNPSLPAHLDELGRIH